MAERKDLRAKERSKSLNKLTREAPTGLEKRKALDTVTKEAPAGLMGQYLTKLDDSPAKHSKKQPISGKKRQRAQDQQGLEARPKASKSQKLDEADLSSRQTAQTLQDNAIAAVLAENETKKKAKQKETDRLRSSQKLTGTQSTPAKAGSKKDVETSPRRSLRSKSAEKVPVVQQTTAKKGKINSPLEKPFRQEKLASKKKRKIKRGSGSTGSSLPKEDRPQSSLPEEEDPWMKGLTPSGEQNPKSKATLEARKANRLTRQKKAADESTLVSPLKNLAEAVQSPRRGPDQDLDTARQTPEEDLVTVYVGKDKKLMGEYDFSSKQISTKYKGETAVVGTKGFLKIANVDGDWKKEIYAAAEEGYEDPTLYKWLKDECNICKRPTNAAQMLICEKCEKQYHTGCLNPPLHSIPKGDWFCFKCKK